MKNGHWRRLGTYEGETKYDYTATVSGRTIQHIVWDASTALSVKRGIEQAAARVPINTWQIGSNDLAGTTLAA